MARYNERLNGLWNNAPTTLQAACIHDTESWSKDGAISWMESQQSGSYHTIVGTNGDETRMVPDNRQAWAAMNQGNRRCLHVCATGYASWSLRRIAEFQTVRAHDGTPVLVPAITGRRDDARDGDSLPLLQRHDGICGAPVLQGRKASPTRWRDYPDELETISRRLATWNRQYGIPLVKITGAQLRAGARGVVGHADISIAFGESDHTDPGRNFPFAPVIARARVLAGQPAGDGLTPDQVRELAGYFAQLGPT